MEHRLSGSASLESSMCLMAQLLESNGDEALEKLELKAWSVDWGVIVEIVELIALELPFIKLTH